MEKDVSRQYEETNPELEPKSELDTTAESLGFLETSDLVLVRRAIIEAKTIHGDTETVKTLLAEYQAMGEKVVEVGERYTDAQIGLIIATAAIRRAIGNIDDAINDLHAALTYAENTGHTEELVRKLRNAIAELENEHDTESHSSKEIAESLALYEDYSLDPETCSEIAAMPFDNAFETAYGYLVQAGLDADEILVQFIQPE